jgi:NADH-quinone oxidoreductase subunit J
MVLFLFVVMLLNAPQEDTDYDLKSHPLLRPGPMRFGAVLAIAFVVELIWFLGRQPQRVNDLSGPSVGSIAEIGRVLFTDYAFPFEVTSVLILVAMVGAVVLARREGGPDKVRATSEGGSDSSRDTPDDRVDRARLT